MSDPLGLISNVGGLPPAQPGRPAQSPGATEGPSFKDVLMQQIGEVNKLQGDAEKAIEDLAAGRRDDMDAVLMAQQKADVAFQMLLQVRNKMMDAYQEIKEIRV